MKKIVYVSRAGLPIDATGIRIEQIGNLLEALGYQIHYICDRRVDSSIENAGYDKIGSAPDLKLNTDEIHFQSGQKIYSYLAPFKGGKINALREMIEIVTAKRAFKRIKLYCENEKPEAIILYNDVFGLTKRLTKYCNHNRIRIIADVTEWYEKRKIATVAERLVISLSNARIQRLDKNLDGIIAISKYFEQYYRNQNVKCIWIPPLMEIEDDYVPQKYEYDKENTVINFVYAGSPGSKDILFPFVEAVMEANKGGYRFRLDVIGIDNTYFKNNGMQDIERYGVFAHGRMPHEQTVQYVKRADFGILFRKNERYAKAGFSTKFAECMSLGVPMICNCVGGADTLICSWENGILTESYEKAELIQVLNRISAMTSQQLISMKTAACTDARKYFNGKEYIERIQGLFD